MARLLRTRGAIIEFLPGRNRCWTYSLIILLSTLPVVAAEAGNDLRRQLEGLASKHEITIKGLDRVGDDPGKKVAGRPLEQIKELLREFNYVLLQDDSGEVEKVFIYGRKSADASPAPWIREKTERRGRHHIVKAVLVGPNGARRTASLIVDTGASTIVLPESMAEALSFQEDVLHQGWSQTANGKVRTRRGVLRFVQIGQVVVEDVAVEFIDNRALGGNGLLGMSFLSRFRFTLDDDNDYLILLKK